MIIAAFTCIQDCHSKSCTAGAAAARVTRHARTISFMLLDKMYASLHTNEKKKEIRVNCKDCKMIKGCLKTGDATNHHEYK